MARHHLKESLYVHPREPRRAPIFRADYPNEFDPGPMLDSDLQHDVIVALRTYLGAGRFEFAPDAT